MSIEIEEIRSQIVVLVERGAYLALNDHRDAIDEGKDKTSSNEKQLTRARRSLEKAAYILSDMD